jgi:hypothetical protein
MSTNLFSRWIQKAFGTKTRQQRECRGERRHRQARRSRLLLEPLEARELLSATIFTVNTTADSGAGSLRQAILDANANPGADIIQFNIGGAGVHTISPTSQLPAITDPVVINGYSQPGASANTLGIGPGWEGTVPASTGHTLGDGDNAVLTIELEGSQAGPTASGLLVAAGNTTIQGLVVNRFSNLGIALSTAGGNIVSGNFIGTNPNGSAAEAIGQEGILVASYGGTGPSNGNTIGGLTPAARNVISGNSDTGILIQTDGNLVEGNFIGTDATGKHPLGNAGAHGGVVIEYGSNNTIGGLTPDARNIISGNVTNGIDIEAVPTLAHNKVQGNYVGTDVTGTSPLPNRQGISDGVGSDIGGLTAGAGNLISGNTNTGISAFNGVMQGNLIGTDFKGTSSIANATGAFVGSEVVGGPTDAARNVISGNGLDGVITRGGDTIQGNYIGMEIDGTTALGNVDQGVFVTSGSNDLIGGTVVGARNVIAGNGFDVRMQQSTGTVIQGNFIGVDKTGNTLLTTSSPEFEIFVDDAVTNVHIGGTATGAKNVIGGSQVGVGIRGTNTSGIVLEGNSIGVGADGHTPIPNGYGVWLFGGTSNNTIGGTAAGAGNVIADNYSAGVLLDQTSSTTPTTGNAIQGNSIYNNTGLGIDINRTPLGQGPDGPNPNDPGDGDVGNNNLQNYPVLSGAASCGATTVTGTLNSTPGTLFTLDFYANTQQDPSGYGEGQRYLGTYQLSQPTDGAGNVSFSVHLAAATSAGEWISATATDPNNNTSEFSADVQVVAPSVSADHAAVSAAENASATNTGHWSNFDEPVTITASTGTVSQTSGSWSWSGSGDEDHPYPVTITATDADGSCSATTTFNVSFTDVPPTVAADHAGVSAAENAAAANTGTFADYDDAVTMTASQGTVTKSGNTTGTWSWSQSGLEEGSYTVTITATNADGAAASTSFAVTVTDPAVLATGGFTLTAGEGSSSGSQTVATFTDPGGAEPAGDYSASISWGDSSSSAGVITVSGGVYTVSGTHTYVEESAPDHPGSTPYQITVTISHEAAAAAVAHSTATVSDPAVVAASVAVSAVEGAVFSNTAVATFTDPGGAEALGDYSASIQWGDGTSTSTGTITRSGSVFTVSGSHTYGEEGSFTVTAVITHEGSSAQTVTSTATVSDPAVAAHGGLVLHYNAGSNEHESDDNEDHGNDQEGSSHSSGSTNTGPRIVATFTDPGGAEPNAGDPAPGIAAHYTASINWGDSTAATPGTITFNSATQVFSVSGAHTYLHEGTFTITTTINHEGVLSTATSSAVVGHTGKITGGGDIGTGRSFGFVAQTNDNGSFKGNLDYQDSANHIKLKSASITFVSIQQDNVHALFTGTATVNGVSGYTFTVTVEDHGEPGIGHDRFRIQFSGPTSYDSNTLAANGGLLTAGNIQVHSGGSSLVADSSSAASSSTGSSGALIDAAGQVLVGVFSVSVQNDNGSSIDPSALARIQDSITYLDNTFGFLGLNLTPADPSSTTPADIRIHLSSSSPLGGVAEGVLGYTTATGDITLVNGWNWYTGTDTSLIGTNQFDFQTVTTHELGHSLGLGHSPDAGSVMYMELASGAVRHTFTTSDLANLHDNDGGVGALHAAIPQRSGHRELPGGIGSNQVIGDVGLHMLSASNTAHNLVLSASIPPVVPALLVAPVCHGAYTESWLGLEDVWTRFGNKPARAIPVLEQTSQEVIPLIPENPVDILRAEPTDHDLEVSPQQVQSQSTAVLDQVFAQMAADMDDFGDLSD